MHSLGSLNIQKYLVHLRAGGVVGFIPLNTMPRSNSPPVGPGEKCVTMVTCCQKGQLDRNTPVNGDSQKREGVAKPQCNVMPPRPVLC